MPSVEDPRAWVGIPPSDAIVVSIPDLLDRPQRYVLDEDSARELRDEIDDALFGLTARRMASRWMEAA